MLRISYSIVLLFFSALTLVYVTGAQQTAPAIQRDPTALSILSQAVRTGGGGGNLSQASGIIAKGNLKVAPAGISGPVLWETQGTEFRYERPGPNGTIVFVSGHGDPALVDGTSIRKNIGHVAMTTLAPHLSVIVLATALNNPNIEVASPQQVLFNSSPAIQISLVDKTNELSALICKQDWYLDAQTLLPVRVDFLDSDIHNALSTAKMSYVFSNYQRVSGLAVPFTVDTLIDDQQISEITFTSIQAASIPPSDFDVPAPTIGGVQ